METWILSRKRAALWGRLGFSEGSAWQCPPPPRAVRPTAALAPAAAGRGEGAKRRGPGPSGAGPLGGDALAGARSMVPRGRPGPRGPVARGRAGRRRGSPSCAARLVSAILDAAAAAASASSSVFAVRCSSLRPERRGGEAGACRRKRKKGVERVGDRARGWRPETERGGEEKAPRPSPSPALPTRPGSLCSPDRRCARPSGHAGASPPLREPFPASACPSPPARGRRGSVSRRRPVLAAAPPPPCRSPHPVQWPPPLPPPGSGPPHRQHGGRENLQQRVIFPE